MKEIRKRLIAVLAALALAFSVFPLGSSTVEVKADDSQATNFVVTTSDGVDGVDVIEAARLWYIYKDKLEYPENYSSANWLERYQAVLREKFEVTDFSTRFNPDGDTDAGREYWDKVNSFVFDEVTVDTEYHNQNFTTKKLTVASGASITLGTNVQNDAGITQIRVKGTAEINGAITLEGIEGKEGILKICNGGTLKINAGATISTPDSYLGYIFVENGAYVQYENQAMTLDGIQLNASQQGNYYLRCVNGSWSLTPAPSVKKNIVLPGDEADYRYTIDYYYDTAEGEDHRQYECVEDNILRTRSQAAADGKTIKKDDQGRDCERPPYFDSITVNSGEFHINEWLRIEDLTVNSGATVILQNSVEGDSQHTNYWRRGVEVTNAFVNGTIEIENSLDPEGGNRLDIVRDLNLGTTGSVSVNGNAEFHIQNKAAFLLGEAHTPVEAKVEVENIFENVFGPINYSVTLDGSQNEDYDLSFANGSWIAKKNGPEAKLDLTLPKEREEFGHTIGLYDWIRRDIVKQEEDSHVRFNSIAVKDDDFKNDMYFTVGDLTVESGRNFTITPWTNNENPDHTSNTRVTVDHSATISGALRIEGDGFDKTGEFEILKGATLTIPAGGSIATDGTGCILAEAGSKIYVGSTPLTAVIDGKSITFNGSQGAAFLQCDNNGTWTGKRVLIGGNVELPLEEESFIYTIDWYYADGSRVVRIEHDYNQNGDIEEDQGEWIDELPPRFDTITISNDYVLKYSVLANKLIVNQDKTLNFGTNQGGWDYVYLDDEGTKATDSNGAPIIITDKWSGQIVVDEVEIAGQVIIDNSTVEREWYDFEQGKVETEPAIKYLEIRDKLTINEGGSLSISGNGELSFGKYQEGKQQEIVIPATSAITTGANSIFTVNPCTKLTVGNDFYTTHVVSGNPYDNAEHDGFVFDGKMNDVWAKFASKANGDWELKDEDGKPFAVWWGAPFENEYRVYFKKGSVKIGGSEFTTNSFHSYTEGTPIEIELVPPTGFTGTPIVFINGGYYNIGEDYMRSDDFKTSDLWWENPATVTKLEVKDNKFTYTPKDDRGIEIYVYYDPEDIMYDAMYFVDRAYLNYGEFRDGNYYFYPDRVYNPDAGEPGQEGTAEFGLQAAWAYPGSEFMVEVTQNNSNGTVEMTPGIDFYRVGNKVKALYQGFEILGGNSVEVKFKPASGYDLLAVTIDGTSYSPSAAGMTNSGGVYTLKITETPTVKDATLNGLYPEDFRKNDYVKIKKISATFGIPSYSGGGDSGSDSGSGTSTDVGTGTGTSTDAGNVGGGSGTTSGEEEPEIQRQTTTTDKADDGTETTTTSTTYTDGSKVTEKVVEKPDGSSTSTTTTTEADGTKVVEKVEEKADGSSKATTTTTETDGTKKTETVEKKKDGTEVTTNTVKDADGNSTTEKVEKKTDGTVTTTNTVKDADGASTTEKVVEKPDGSVTTTSTEKDADGNVLSTSKVVEKTKEDGTKTITATEKNADGSSSTSKTTINTDGSSKTNTTTQNADGSTTKEKITEKADGSLTRTATTTDEDGNVLATEKEKVTVSKSGTETSTTTIENADGSSSESVVKTKADGSATSTLTETDADGNVSVTVGSTKKDGSGISKSYAVEDDGVVLTAVEATTASASIPATVKVNGKSVPVTTVGEGAMKDNTSVKKVTLAESITSIGEDAFSGAKNLKTIKLSANVTEIAPGAFDGIKSNATFYISAETDEEFNALVELLKKSGVGSKVKFKRA